MSDSVSFDETAAAAKYLIQNQRNWAKNALLAGAQALANIKILEKQQDQYEDIATDRKKTIQTALDRYVDRVNGLLSSFEGAYPDVPQAAEYVPVDPCSRQNAQIECNIGLTTNANEWAVVVNRLQAQSDYTRMVVLDPRWYVNINLFSLTLGQLLRGEYPLSDLMEEMTDSAEMGLATGKIGGNRSMTQRNLASGRLRMQQMGREALKAEAAMAARINPTKRMASADDMMMTTQQRIGLALTQAQLIQNSLQNVYNRKAEKSPYKLAQLNLKLETAINKLQVEASKASLVNTFVPNYAAILQPQINALTSTVSEGLDRPFSPSTGTDDPQIGGSFLEQSGANPFSSGLGSLSSGHKASDRPVI